MRFVGLSAEFFRVIDERIRLMPESLRFVREISIFALAAMASGGMDTLPHNGAVITLLAVTGLTHRQSYKDVFAITLIKTAAVFFVIGVFYATGLV
jgi:H+/gluconate symporter-like permease